mmetsp:Transcript_13914/g.27656  ORF Transcript_13914/g.27656 Transcript_13914/m.27656 type:complete len:141 (-) Transcript_13914:755-1177(-)
MPSAFVPESVLKKRRTAATLAKAKEASDVVAVAKAKSNKAEMMKRAETYVAEYKTLENDSIRLRREAKTSGSYYVPAEPNLAFVTRIRGASFPRVGQSLRFICQGLSSGTTGRHPPRLYPISVLTSGDCFGCYLFVIESC